jgi:dTDP-4-amino-4,6-dideoxygalactose transaminase
MAWVDPGERGKPLPAAHAHVPSEQNPPMKIKQQTVPFHAASVGEDEAKAAADVIRSGWLTMGAKTIEFERNFASYVCARHAIGVSSCTAAMHLALEAAGLQQGDEVLVPTTTFTATAEVVVYFKAIPVLVDVDPITLCIDPDEARRKVTSRTRAILPVHFAGQPCDMDRIEQLAASYRLHVIEDAAHSLPASFRGTPVGAISKLTAFSFYATKTLTTGEGGMVTTDDDGLAARMRIMRLHGIGKDAWRRYSSEGSWYYEVTAAGFKYNLTDIQSAIGIVQLNKCTEMCCLRARIAKQYTEAFSQCEEVEPPTVLSDRESAWHLYVLRLNLERLKIGRSEVVEQLKQRGVGTSVHFIPLHMHPYYRNTYHYCQDSFPVALREYYRSFSLPIYPGMSLDQVAFVIEQVLEVMENGRR